MADNRLKIFMATFDQRCFFVERSHRESGHHNHNNARVSCEYGFSKNHRKPCQEKNDVF